MSKFSEKMQEQFGTEEIIGVEYRNPDGLLLSDYHGDNPEDEEFWAYLPNGETMGRCTNCAHFVVDKLGEGRVYGFATSDNPVESEHIQACFGHDFAVLRDRYIVDVWISVFAGIEKQMVYDLWNPKDAEKIKLHYGNPELWGIVDLQTKHFRTTEPSEVVRLGKPESSRPCLEI